MANYHEPGINKIQRIIGYILSILFSLIILMAGFAKIVGAEPIMENMSKIPNWEDKVLFLGVLEIALLALYWIPRTGKLGFYLLCSYVGGIIVAEVVSGQAPVTGIVVAVFLYAGTVMRNPSMLK
ncbi:MAG: DoxX family protein [Bacteroidia bacterium]|nr:DoxX family protein [Bacteroidia bacterium]